MDALFMAPYRKHGEKWKHYFCVNDEFPNDDEIKESDGVIVPGSSLDSYKYKEIPLLPKLYKLTKDYITNYPYKRFLGICFGHQVTAMAMGGNVEPMIGGKIRKGEYLKIEDGFYEKEFVKKSGLTMGKEVYVSKAHGDHVVKLPVGAVNYASSKTTSFEIICIGENYLGF